MNKALLTFIFLLAIIQSQQVKAEGIHYFFGPGLTFDTTIPTPEEFLGYETGNRITEHSRINAYYEKLAELSDRTSLIEIGRTHENRKLYVLIVSSPENIRELDGYKENRKRVREGEKPDGPLIVFLGNTVHGNETSSAEAALLAAYYFTAAQNDFVKQQLEEGIYFIDPVRNPDGQERFASWINSNTSVLTKNISPYDREHTEGWPRGRGNHYWFDLNRDWVNIVHPESKARVALYQEWLPHVQADHHEMGTNNTFFFEPTNPDGNESRFVPQSTYKLNRLFADYFAEALDKIGSFYYTKESYDNKNPNFGSSYPDFNGGVGILFEQGSSRGLSQESENGIVTLAFTVRNQLVTSIATVDAANAHKDDLFDLQKEFFTPSRGKEAARSFIIGDSHDLSRLHKFVQLLLHHRLEVYENAIDITIDSVRYEKGKSFFIPAGQANSALVGIIFDDLKDENIKTDEEVDKLSYGAGFSVAYASGLSYDVTTSSSRGARVLTLPQAYTGDLQQSEYAYLVDYRDAKSQQLLFRLLEEDILVKAAFKPFSIQRDNSIKEFSYGSLLIPVKNQSITSSELYALLKETGVQEKVDIIPVTTGLNVNGVDLGSRALRRIEKPKVLVVTGGDISATEAGEVWHLFDQQLKYPLVRVEYNHFGRVPLHEFNRIVFVSGNYSFLEDADMNRLKNWLSNGGTLITVNRASRWAVNQNISSAKFVVSTDTSDVKQDRRIIRRSFPTSVFQTKIDLKHPLAFGLTNEKLPVVRESDLFLASSPNSVSAYTDEPLLNGYISPGHLKDLKGSASILVTPAGRGNVILFAEDPLFRGIWDVTSRTFVNAVLFGNNIPGR